MAKIRVGVFGGARGFTMINQLLARDDAVLTAVCDKYRPLLDRVGKKAEELGQKVALCESFDEFMEQDMDAVVLANYANEHVPYAVRLLNSGRHVMSEVLTCSNMAEAVELIEAVEKTGLVYTYAENYCYTPARQEMRRRYLAGDIGELLYAEGEYIHDCSSIWPQITYGERNHWRNLMSSTFYNTHSLGPLLKMTGLRPVSVSGFETPLSPHMLELGACFGSGGMEIVTLNNGAVVKSLHGDLKHAAHSRYYLSGTRGGLLDPNRDCMVCAYTEGPGENCRGKKEEYKAEHPIAEAGQTGHGGGDYYTVHFFIRSILGDEEAKKMAVNVYEAVDMCTPGILGYKSVLEGNRSYRVPDLRRPEERDAWRNDRACTFPDIAGDQVLPNRIDSISVPDSTYERVKQLWIDKKPG
ncbi:MAG: Gfo/Idh/MocA family oxidoreductase [Clostridia bacterium]|nr:Gfo/Idh/MocA family oxidoreductase [Clostridia bacterium]